jgi:hypothetical protein
MAAIYSTMYTAMECGYPVKTALFSVATTGDWFKMGAPGVIPIACNVFTTASSGYTATPYYANVLVTTTVSTTTGTSVVYKAAANPWLMPQGPFYILTAGREIMMCTYNSGYSATAGGGSTGTMTVIRGCLGTTATTTGLVAGNTLHILKVLKFSTNSADGHGAPIVGPVMMAFMELPDDPKAYVFPQA